MIKRIISLGLAALLVTAAMTSCTPKESVTEKENGTGVEDKNDVVNVPETNASGDAVITIGNTNVNENEYAYYYRIMKMYREEGAADISDPEEFKKFHEEILKELKLNAALEKLAADNNIVLSDEEYKTGVTDYFEQVKSSYGEDFDDALKNEGLTEEIFINQLRLNTIYQKIVTELTAEGQKYDISDVEKIKAAALEGNYIHAKHILVQFGTPDYEKVEENGEGMTDEQKAAAKEKNEKAKAEAEAKDKAEKLEKANEVLKKVEAGEDFDKLVTEYNEDPGMQTYPGGYYFKEGDMVTEFYEAAKALEEGKTSGLVETSYGYHIIKRLPYDDESLMASSYAQEQTQTQESELIMKDLESMAAEMEVKYTTDFDTKYSYENMEKLIAPEEAAPADGEAEAPADGEAETPAEGEAEAQG